MIKDIIDATIAGITELDEWCEEVYQKNFAKYFDRVRDLYVKLKRSDITPISDTDLSMIITELPMEMFSASEAVHRLKTHQELMKLNVKRNKLQSNGETDPEMAQWMDAVSKAYENIISRAEKEISYCRELIMGAKKIWDARRRTEGAMPISEVIEEPKSSKSKNQKLQDYIK